jgi:creatinine amidohydrolase
MTKKTSTTEKKYKPILLEELNWKQIDALPRDTTIIYIPISPLEEHGPHLPIGTDFLTSRDAAKTAISQLKTERQELTPILFPAIPIGFTKMAACFPGTVSTNARALKTIISDILSSLAVYGFQFFVICTFHMDLGHLKGIHLGIQKVKRRYNIKVTEPWSSYFFNKTAEKREPDVGFDTKKEVHAGFRETSLMKYQYPYLVDKNHISLKNVYHNLFSLRTLGKNFKDLGINDGYVGSPALGDSNYGRWFFQETVTTFIEAGKDLIDGKPLPELPRETKLMMKSLFWI